MGDFFEIFRVKLLSSLLLVAELEATGLVDVAAESGTRRPKIAH